MRKLVLLVAFLLPAAPAAADERIVAGPPSQYLTPNATIDQGEPLFFRNFDLLTHDVTARQNGPDGKPLFSTPLVGPGPEPAVAGAQSLTAGSYEFFCSIHPNMVGKLNVTTAGTPQPGSGGGGGGGGSGGGSGGQHQHAGATLTLKLVDSRASKARKAGRLRVRAEVNEAANVTLEATYARKGKAVTIARGSRSFDGAGAATVSLKLTRAGKSALKRSVTVTIGGLATHSSGHQISASTSRKLRR
jgi:plastocyanin